MSKKKALEIAGDYGTIDGGHHKMWVIDQMVRALTNCPINTLTILSGVDGNKKSEKIQGESEEYKKFVADLKDNDYEWDTGIAP